MQLLTRIPSNSGKEICSSKKIGYNPADLIQGVDNEVDFGSASEDTSRGLTRVMVLHIVGTIFAFIAFLESYPSCSQILDGTNCDERLAATFQFKFLPNRTFTATKNTLHTRSRLYS